MYGINIRHQVPCVFTCNKSLEKFKESWQDLWSPLVFCCGTPVFCLFLNRTFVTASFSSRVGRKGSFGLTANKVAEIGVCGALPDISPTYMDVCSSTELQVCHKLNSQSHVTLFLFNCYHLWMTIYYFSHTNF